jgi:general secretion pathway protein C
MPKLSILLLNLALIALLGWQLAQWTWLFFTPKLPVSAPTTRAAPNPDTLLETIRSAQLFGSAGTGVQSSAATNTPLNIKLTGVFAASGRQPAAAIIDTGEKNKSVFASGDAVLPDVVLEEVHADHVILKRGGARERLALERKTLPQGAILEQHKLW